MSDSILHITNGDAAGALLAECGVGGELLVWRDVLYDGLRNPGWPTLETLHARAGFIADMTAGGLSPDVVRRSLDQQYARLRAARRAPGIVLWFDACLFDQSMLAHVITCLAHLEISGADLLCVDAFPGISPYNGLGQLTPEQLASVYDQRRPLTAPDFAYAERVDRAFATQDANRLAALAEDDAEAVPLPWVPAAVRRWLAEQPDPATGLGLLETLALDAISEGADSPSAVFRAVAAADTPPQYWGDTTLWAKIYGLARRQSPLVAIDGPTPELPQWEGGRPLAAYRLSVGLH